MASSVLVACVTSAEYDVHWAQWKAAYDAMTYATKSLFVVDTTPGTTAYRDTMIGRGIDCVHVEPDPIDLGFLTAGWKAFADEVTTQTYLLSLEADVIVPAGTLTVAVEIADRYNLAWLSHDYPDTATGDSVNSLGIALVRVSALAGIRDAGWGEAIPSRYGVDAYIYQTVIASGGRVLQMANFVNVTHL